jgi:hypothetical protein
MLYKQSPGNMASRISSTPHTTRTVTLNAACRHCAVINKELRLVSRCGRPVA